MTCSSGATRCGGGLPRARCARAPHPALLRDALPSAPPPRRQIEYHLVELPPRGEHGAEHGPRLALIAPEVIERLEQEDAHLALCVRGRRGSL